MIDPEKLVAFALVSGTTSMIPGPSMLFVMGQAMWRGSRSGAAAVAGVELGYIVWWCFAALGLGTLALAFPLAFRLLAIGGAIYLGWLGLKALRHSATGAMQDHVPPLNASAQAFRAGILVAIGNPKALIYIVALLPPFVDPHSPVVPQLVVLASVAIVIDVALSVLYILAGNRLARAMARPSTRRWLDRVVGTIFLAIAAGILIDLAGIRG